MSLRPRKSQKSLSPSPSAQNLKLDAKLNGSSKKTASRSSSDDPLPIGKLLGGGTENLTKRDFKILVILLVMGAWVRIWRIWFPAGVVFDEVHHGGFVSRYILSSYFVDVHPPLGKLILTLTGWLSGYDGISKWVPIGIDYISQNVPYVPLRLAPAISGLLLVPTAFITLRMTKINPIFSALGAMMVLFDNALITQSKFILLDSFLILGTGLCTMTIIGVFNESKGESEAQVVKEKEKDDISPANAIPTTIASFNPRFLVWLFFLSLSLAFTVSTKLSGFLTLIYIGLLTLVHLLSYVPNLRIPVSRILAHTAIRGILLLGVPAIVYVTCFWIHFKLLGKKGDGVPLMSMEFQRELKGMEMEDVLEPVYLGSNVTIRHLHSPGGYLHSHSHDYPEGSQQQQVTCYPHEDIQNSWLLLDHSLKPRVDHTKQLPLVPIKNGNMIMLKHVDTARRLHSHDVKGSQGDQEFMNEVSAYGYEGFEGDRGDWWLIEFVDDSLTPYVEGELTAIGTKFRLKHQTTGCYLFSHRVKLPEWGFGQQEVLCNKESPVYGSVWFIEKNDHPLVDMETAKKINYRRLSFWEKFVEVHKVMFRVNSDLTTPHMFESRPQDWPLIKRGLGFWAVGHRSIYLIGNPFVWWTGALGVGFTVLGLVVGVLRWKRGYKDYASPTISSYLHSILIFLTGYFLHYLPYFLQKRQLFLHHYLPSLYFSVLLVAVLFDMLTRPLPETRKLKLAGVVLGVVVWGWMKFAPMAYGGEWTVSECESARWRQGWDFACHDFPESYSEYNDYNATDVTYAQFAEAFDPEGKFVKKYFPQRNPAPEPAEAINVEKEEEGGIAVNFAGEQVPYSRGVIGYQNN